MNAACAPWWRGQRFSNAVRKWGGSPGRWLAIAVWLAVFSAPTRAADLLVGFADQTQTATGGSFEVDLTNTSTTQSYGVASFSLELTVNPTSGIQFTDATTTTTTNPYIFDGTGTASIDPTFDFVASSSTPTDLIVGDSEWMYPSIAVGPSSTFGLALVSYSLDSGSSFDLSSVQLGLATDIVDEFGNTIPLINGSVAVPEPSTLVLLAIGSLGLVGLRWRHHSRSAKPRGRENHRRRSRAA